MTDEQFKSIQKMVSSNDKDMVVLGQTMLFNFSLELNEKEILAIYCNARLDLFKRTRQLNDLKRKLKAKYINVR